MQAHAKAANTSSDYQIKVALFLRKRFGQEINVYHELVYMTEIRYERIFSVSTRALFGRFLNFQKKLNILFLLKIAQNLITFTELLF